MLIIVENLPVPFDRRVWLEATTLSRAGFTVSVICPTGRGFEKSFEVLEDVAIYRHQLPLEASSGLGYLLEYGAALFWQTVLSLRIYFSRGFHAIHACNPPDLIFFVALLFKPFGVKFLFDQHDLCPEVYEAKFNRRGMQYSILKFLERCTFGLADVVISTNGSYRNIAMGRGGKKPEDVFVVRSGPDLDRWRLIPARDGKWLNGRRFLVGYVGVMGEQEGLEFLVEAARLIVFETGRSDIQFILVGDGSHRAFIMDMVQRLGLGEYFTFTGRVSDEDLINAVSSCDICVNPDKFSELNDKSTMNKIVEYMALGRPIVQFDLTEGRVSAGEAALYATPDDPADFARKILELLAEPERREAMGRFGRSRVEQELAWSHQTPALLAAYERLLA